MALDRITPQENRNEDVTWMVTDLEDTRWPDCLYHTIEGCPAWVHLAWDMSRGAGVYLTQAKQLSVFARLLNVWSESQVCRLVIMGSAAEYGRREGLIHEDERPILPLSPYGWAKYSASLLAESWAHSGDRQVTWLRPFVVYGPGQRGDMLIPYALSHAFSHSPASFSDGEQERDFVYVADVIEAIIAALAPGKPGFHLYNVGSGQAVKVQSVLREIEQVTGVQGLFELGVRPRKKSEPQCQIAHIERAREVLDWYPRTLLREGLRRTVEGLINE